MYLVYIVVQDFSSLKLIITNTLVMSSVKISKITLTDLLRL